MDPNALVFNKIMDIIIEIKICKTYASIWRI